MWRKQRFKHLPKFNVLLPITLGPVGITLPNLST